MDKTKKTEEKKQENDQKQSSEVEQQKCVCGDCDNGKKGCEKCEEMAIQVDEYKAKYLRAIADYQNLERRVQDQKGEWTKMANKNVILKLLSFLDDLERAEAFIKDANFAHVKESFMKMLKNEGLEELDVVNKQYDPYTAEVIDMKEGIEDNLVLSVLRKGYTYNGQLLRIAQVTVSKKA